MYPDFVAWGYAVLAGKLGLEALATNIKQNCALDMERQISISSDFNQRMGAESWFSFIGEPHG
jgi:hypothetical protein